MGNRHKRYGGSEMQNAKNKIFILSIAISSPYHKPFEDLFHRIRRHYSNRIPSTNMKYNLIMIEIIDNCK